jgi:hypothetical protein
LETKFTAAYFGLDAKEDSTESVVGHLAESPAKKASELQSAEAVSNLESHLKR